MELNLTKPLCVFDIETTGLILATDRIVEICLHRIDPDHSERTLTLRLNPTIRIPREVSAIHGIYDQDVADCPTFKAVANELVTFMKDCDLAGYNAISFDIPILVEEFLRVGVNFDMTNRRFVDVQNIFHRMERRTLSAAYKFYCQKKLEGAHGAEVDTLATYEILKAQLDRYQNEPYEETNGQVSYPVINDVSALATFSTLRKNVDFAGVMVYNQQGLPTFNIGKHKGKLVTDVFRTEPSYYNWMMNADFTLYTKKIITEIHNNMVSPKL
ncbi:DNA polymerase III subunit epsilon [Bacteroidia bacterium]|nr:DNA polymerase III subunit epsilon [Bacteroidia bacterium]